MEYTWNIATLADVDAIVKLAQDNYQWEIDTIFTPDPRVYARNLAYIVLNQHYYPGKDILLTARATDTGDLLAYNWATSSERAWWSDERMVSARMANVNMQLPTRLRVKLIKEMMGQWEQLAVIVSAPIIYSNTIRHDQQAFLRLHERMGYSVRGSFAYKRIGMNTTAAGLAIP